MEIMLIDFLICLLSTLIVMCVTVGYVHYYLGRDKA